MQMSVPSNDYRYNKDFQPRLPNGNIIDAKNTCASIVMDPDDVQEYTDSYESNHAPAAIAIDSSRTIIVPIGGVYPADHDMERQTSPFSGNFNGKHTSPKKEAPASSSSSWSSKRNMYISLAALSIITIGLIGFVVGTFVSDDAPSSFTKRLSANPMEVLPTIVTMAPIISPNSSPILNLRTTSPSNEVDMTPTVISTINTTTITPTVSPIITSTISPTTSTGKREIVVDFINSITLSNQIITLDGITSESKAIIWMIENDPWIVNTSTAILASSLNALENNEIRFRISQRYSLLTLWFQQELTTPPLNFWRETTGWLVDPIECNWSGLACFESMSIDGIGDNYTFVIEQIDFNDFSTHQGNNLVGTIPADLGLLSHMVKFDVTSNGLTGTLPESIGRWSDMTEFYCANNSISGTVPSSVGNWNNLSVFSIAFCNLNGSIPESIGNWRNVNNVHFFGNQFTGPLPESIGQLTAMTSFSAYENLFTGTLPESIGQLTALKSFLVYGNSLSGALPESIGQLTALTTFSVADNQFNGTIPASIGNWSNIEIAHFFDNELTGAMPIGICKNIANQSGDELTADCARELLCACCTVCL